VTADDLVVFGEGAIVQATEPITIGTRTVISQYAMLLTETGDCTTAGKTKRKGAITIKPDCWIATDAVVMPNSTIEDGVIVGARSLVDGHLSEWKICTGEPARPRADRVLYGTS
jgi:putative colanic acid biosynthesis acetyltransferase WcaF